MFMGSWAQGRPAGGGQWQGRDGDGWADHQRDRERESAQDSASRSRSCWTLRCRRDSTTLTRHRATPAVAPLLKSPSARPTLNQGYEEALDDSSRTLSACGICRPPWVTCFQMESGQPCCLQKCHKYHTSCHMGVRQNPPHPVWQKGWSLDPYPDAYPMHARCMPDACPKHAWCIPDSYPDAYPDAAITFT